MRLVAGLAVLLVTTTPVAAAPPIDDLVAAITSSDTAAVTRFVADYYRDAGISVNDTLDWRTQAFDEIVNWYNPHTEEIMLAELPTPEQTSAYWDNWSRVLTQGRWNWQGFFADSDEAYRIAGFNQFLLAAHEYGHALTYRYDREHEQRGEGEINCREYPADRLAAALLEEVAEADARVAALRVRYAGLIAAINAEIDPASRYDVPSFDQLNADCRILHVEQPTDEASMTPYASAFFARHGVLLATDLPTLREIYDTYLLPYWRALRPAAAGRAGAVTTLTSFPEVPEPAEDKSLPRAKVHLAPALDGTLYYLETATSDGAWPPRMSLSYGQAGAPLEKVLRPQSLPIGRQPGSDLYLGNALALGPDQFVLVDNTFSETDIWLFSVRRIEGRWQLLTRRLVRPNETFFPRLVFDAAGTVNLVFSERINEESYDTAIRWVRVEPTRLSVTPMPDLPDLPETPVALLADGTPLNFEDGTLLIWDGDQGLTFAGSGLQGLKDHADPMLAEIAVTDPVVLPDPDGGIRFIDYDPANAVLVLRHVAPAQ